MQRYRKCFICIWETFIRRRIDTNWSRRERAVNLKERESETDCICMYIRDYIYRYIYIFVVNSTYLLFGNLEGFQVVANYAQLFFKLDDLPVKWKNHLQQIQVVNTNSYLWVCFFKYAEENWSLVFVF